MKNFKNMVCLSLLALLMALPQMTQAASMPMTMMNAPQGDIITVSVMGQQFTGEAPLPVSLLPITVQITAADGTLLYSATQAVGNISVSAKLIRGDGINALSVSDAIAGGALSVSDAIANGYTSSVSDAIAGGSIVVSQGANIIVLEDFPS